MALRSRSCSARLRSPCSASCWQLQRRNFLDSFLNKWRNIIANDRLFPNLDSLSPSYPYAPDLSGQDKTRISSQHQVRDSEDLILMDDPQEEPSQCASAYQTPVATRSSLRSSGRKADAVTRSSSQVVSKAGTRPSPQAQQKISNLYSRDSTKAPERVANQPIVPRADEEPERNPRIPYPNQQPDPGLIDRITNRFLRRR